MEDLTDILGKPLSDDKFILELLRKKLEPFKSKEIEIESRLGKLIDTFTSERLRIASMHPVILENSNDFRFETGVRSGDFEKIKKLFSDLESVKISDKTFSHQGMRKTVCNGVEKTIKKSRLLALNIYLPDKAYDLRIAVAKEVEMPNFMKKGGFERERDRETFKIDNLQYDFTIINELYRNNQTSEKIYEVETEMINADGDLDDFLRSTINLGTFLE
ncbi:Cyclin B, kinase-activating protein [Pseudoloma neurophilia]|uniref:mRNA-capping enzyme subunit beta n=1 Tax=Pseudoloma neurophilia TaxID=146866 RepID=A0A0R0M0I4_9MICR|nr:Cyclin B, kinase-activating protein [Pseudoloma neurophilia]